MEYQSLSSPFNLTLAILAAFAWLFQILLYYRSCTRPIVAELVIRKNEKKSILWYMGMSAFFASIYMFMKIPNNIFFIYLLLIFAGNLCFLILNSKFKPAYLYINMQSVCINAYFTKCYDLTDLKALSFDGLSYVLKLKFNNGKSLRIRTKQLEEGDYKLLLETLVSKAPEEIEISRNLQNIMDAQ